MTILKTNLPTRKEMEILAKEEMEKIFNRVPYTREFHEGRSIDNEYYKRHLIETVLRINLNNEVDAYSLYKIGNKDTFLFHKLAEYLAEEAGHEALFLNDLKKFGIEKSEVDSTSPFFSTQLLIGYLYYSINQDGPLPTMVWNWFVEWYSDQFNMTITNKAAEDFGDDKIKGSMHHLTVDEDEDHVGLMYSTVEHAIKSEEDGEKAKDYLKNFVKLIGQYFQELHENTLAQK
jgi:hypothetical protein